MVIWFSLVQTEWTVVPSMEMKMTQKIKFNNYVLKYYNRCMRHLSGVIKKAVRGVDWWPSG